jgi:mannose-6-phosphate isomerase-like protein (cupin superfamily)
MMSIGPDFMNDTSPLTPAIVLPSSGKHLFAFGEEVIVHLGGIETGGKLAMWTEITPPGGGPPPHYHLSEDEWFFPLEGRVEFFKDDVWEEVPMGTAVFMPRRVIHAFRNPGDKPLRMLIHTTPSGFEIFFDRCAEEFAKSQPPDMARIVEIGVEHGIHFVGVSSGE